MSSALPFFYSSFSFHGIEIQGAFIIMGQEEFRLFISRIGLPESIVIECCAWKVGEHNHSFIALGQAF